MLHRITKLWPHFLVVAITFSIGLGVGFGHRQRKHNRCLRGSTLVLHRAQRCPSRYYGLGEGDGVFDEYCFSIEKALARAGGDGDIAGIRGLLLAGANPNSHAGDAFQPLHIAAENGRTEAVRVLLDAGADVDIRDATWGWTPLMLASNRGNTDLVRLLLARGADVTLQGSDGTALHLAEVKHRDEVVRILREAGARE